jgi:hypothetical protein
MSARQAYISRRLATTEVLAAGPSLRNPVHTDRTVQELATMRSRYDIGPDGEIFEDGLIHVPFPVDLEQFDEELFD